VTFEWETTAASAQRILLHNALGQSVRDIALSRGTSYTLSLQELPSGIYFWALLAGNGKQIEAGKLIKE
jgi:predicted secreted protein